MSGSSTLRIKNNQKNTFVCITLTLGHVQVSLEKCYHVISEYRSLLINGIKSCTFHTHPFVSKLLYSAVQKSGLPHGSGHVESDVKVEVGHGADVPSSPNIVCLRQSCGQRLRCFKQFPGQCLHLQSAMESGH